MDIQRALQALVPDARFAGTIKDNTMEQYRAIEWKDERKQPGEQEIVAACTALEAEDAKTDYLRLRAAEYPPVGDQLDAIWKALNSMQLQGVFDLPTDTDLVRNQWLAVKAKYPKPE